MNVSTAVVIVIALVCGSVVGIYGISEWAAIQRVKETKRNDKI